MKTIKLSLMLLIFSLPIVSSADEYFEKIKNKDELMGCWKRINFSESAMKMMNQLESVPLEHQWYCFLENGKYWDLYSNQNDRSMAQILSLMTAFPGQDYSIPREGMVFIIHNETNEKMYWVTSIVVKDVTLWDVDIKQGDVLMTIRNPVTKKDIYYRFMRKLKDS